MEKKKARVAVLVSGGGTNLQAIIDAEKSGIIHSGTVALVISNNETAYAIKRADQAGIPSRVLLRREYGSQAGFEEALVQTLLAEKIDIIVLAGFMTILSGAFTKRFPKRILNVHPSLIPSFCGQGFYGLKVHEEALKRGVKVTGATVHFVNEIPDGGEILFQKAVDVLGDDTPEILQRRVMEEAEWILLPKAVEEVSKRVCMNLNI